MSKSNQIEPYITAIEGELIEPKMKKPIIMVTPRQKSDEKNAKLLQDFLNYEFEKRFNPNS